METFGRNRQSLADIEQELFDLFADHASVAYNAEGQPYIPADGLIDVIRTFSRNHDFDLMDQSEEEKLNDLLTSIPGLECTPAMLLQFIAQRTSHTPDDAPPPIPPKDSPNGSPPPDADLSWEEVRGRRQELDNYPTGGYSRSSSRDSIETSVWNPGSRPSSRPPSRGPITPKTPNQDSPFENTRRQRAAPLKGAVPSSWARRPPPTRRKSDASQQGRAMSDSESIASPPSAFNRGGNGRARAPSNPTSPSTSFSTFSPPSRPHSRAQSQPQNTFVNFDSFDQDIEDYDYDQTMTLPSQTRSNSRTGLITPPPSDTSFEGSDDNDIAGSINSLPMPKTDDDDEEELERDRQLGLIFSRSNAPSTVSMEETERMEALQKTNLELGKKLLEAENTLQVRLGEHESELEEMHSKLEAAKNELSATKREEKELRAKERTNSTQILALESEITKIQKSLENARTSYQSLQKQYQEQCHESERYRDLLRRRDEEIKTIKEQADMTSLEAQKLASVAETYEAQIEALHQELEAAQQAVSALDEQKQENMFLKETIDRMRFDMDEMRTSSGNGPGSGAASVRGSVSRSLGAELLGKMKWQAEGDAEYVTDEPEDEQASDEEEEEIEELVRDGDDTESEDVIQTIITRTKRKVANRARRIETVKIDEVKEYSDASTQHEISEFTHSMNVQTDPEPKPITRTFSTQTEARSLASTDIQTDPEPVPEPVLRVEMDIQTEPEPEPEIESEPEEEQPEASASNTPPSELEDETLASSSSTLVPPTPKQSDHLHPHDLPPAYNQVQDDLAVRVANETLKTWHKGLKLPIEPLAGGISEDAVEEWKSLKEELGIECSAIDKIVAESTRTGLPRPSKDGRQGRRRSRFYNIYNTYVYGGDKEGSSVSSIISSSQFLFCLGASAAVAFIVGHSTAPQYNIPGGATYYDRAAWASYNTFQAAGEGFPGDSTSLLWGFLGRLGGGAARSLRGWPT